MIEPTTPEDVTALKPLQSGAQRWVNGLLNRLSPSNPDGEVAQIYKKVARDLAVKVALKAKDFSSKFPTITVSSNT